MITLSKGKYVIKFRVSNVSLDSVLQLRVGKVSGIRILEIHSA